MVNVKILSFRKIIFSQKKSNIINGIVTLVNIEPIFEYIYGGNQKHQNYLHGFTVLPTRFTIGHLLK